MILIVTTKISDRAILIANLWKKSNQEVGILYCQKSPVFDDLTIFDFTIKCNNEEEISAIALRFENKTIHYLNYGPDLLGLQLLNSQQKYILDYKDMWGLVRIPEIPINNSILERAIVDSALSITYRDNQLFNYCKLNNCQIDNKIIFYIPEMFESNYQYEQNLAKSINLRSNDSLPIKIVTSGGAQDFDDPEPRGDLRNLAQQNSPGWDSADIGHLSHRAILSVRWSASACGRRLTGGSQGTSGSSGDLCESSNE
jgi:hypothetical protein